MNCFEVHSVQNILKQVVHDGEWALAFIGGSKAKALSDDYSDTDIGLIYSDDLMLARLRDFISSSYNVIYYETAIDGDHIVLSNQSKVFDLHIISDYFCKTAIQNFESGLDISTSTQDLLWNISNGKQIASIGSCAQYSVRYTWNTQKKILNKYLPLLSTQKLDIYFKRKDFVQQWEASLTIAKVLINIGCALNGELFWGYKNSRHKTNYPKNIKETLELLEGINALNYSMLFPSLKEKISNIASDIIEVLNRDCDDTSTITCSNLPH